MRQSNRIKQFSWMVAVVFLLASVVQAAETARLLTSAKVNVYRDGQLVQVLKENAPLPQGALLKPEGDCGVRMAYMSLVAKAGSAFAVRQDGPAVELRVESGTVYFAASSAANKTVFKTPAGLIVVQQLIVRTAADGVLKGFVQVEDGKATLGVLEGGDMVVSTVEGERMIRSREGHTIRFVDSHENAGNHGALIIEDAHGNVITMTNGVMTINARVHLTINALSMTIMGRPVNPLGGEI